MKAVVFDIGNVLIQWDPRLAYASTLGMAGAEAFLARIGFAALNLRADAGETFAVLAQEVPDPEDRALLAQYPARYAPSVPTAIEGTWALMDRLRVRGHQIHAITNWSAETWPVGIATHPRLATSFGVVVVSGQERIIKPDPRIFALLCERAGLAPRDCLFIDDGPHNVKGAQAVGMEAIHFTTPEALEADLTARGLL